MDPEEANTSATNSQTTDSQTTNGDNDGTVENDTSTSSGDISPEIGAGSDELDITDDERAFASYFDDLEQIDPDANEEIVEQAPAQEAVTQENKPAEEKPKAEEQPDPANVKAEEAAAAPTAEGEQKTVDPQAVLAQYENWRGQAEATLADSVYKFTPEQVEAFQENPEKVLAQFAAKTHMEILGAAMMNLGRLVPQIVQQHTIQQRVTEQSANAFYEQFTDPTQRDVVKNNTPRVQQLAAQLKAIAPDKKRSEFMRDLAQLVRMDLKLSETAPAPAAQAARRTVIPPAPAAARGGAMAAPVAPPANAFELLAAELEGDI